MSGTCTGTITVEIPCTPSWQCIQPLMGWMSDGCGNMKQDSSCNPVTIYPNGTRVKIISTDPNYIYLTSYTGTITDYYSPNGNYYITYDTPNTLGWTGSWLTPGIHFVLIAAADGSTPKGTIVCIINIYGITPGTIWGWDGTSYTVKVDTWYVSFLPSEITLGNC